MTKPAAAAAACGLSVTSGKQHKSFNHQVSGDALIPGCKNLLTSGIKEIGTPPTAAVKTWTLPPGQKQILPKLPPEENLGIAATCDSSSK